MVNAKLHLLHENGLLDMWSNEMVAEAGKCDTVGKAVASHGESNNLKLTMEYVDSLFLIFWGFSLAILGLMVELIWNCICSKRTASSTCAPTRWWSGRASATRYARQWPHTEGRTT